MIYQFHKYLQVEVAEPRTSSLHLPYDVMMMSYFDLYHFVNLQTTVGYHLSIVTQQDYLKLKKYSKLFIIYNELIIILWFDQKIEIYQNCSVCEVTFHIFNLEHTIHSMQIIKFMQFYSIIHVTIRGQSHNLLLVG